MITRLKAPEGQYLTQAAQDVPLAERVIAAEIVLGAHDCSENWLSITEDEAEAIRAEQAAALAKAADEMAAATSGAGAEPLIALFSDEADSEDVMPLAEDAQADEELTGSSKRYAGLIRHRDKLNALPTADELDERFNASADNLTREVGRIDTAVEEVQEQLSGKAERSELSPVMMSDELTPANFPDITHYSREELKLDLLIDMWNARCFAGTAQEVGRYNPESKCFEFGEDKNVSAEDALAAVVFSPVSLDWGSTRAFNSKTRIVLPGKWGATEYGSLKNAYAYAQSERIALTGYYGFAKANVLDGAFQYCRFLKVIVGVIDSSGSNKGAFTWCYALETVWIKGLMQDISFADSSLLRMECVKYLVDNAANTAAITVTLHPDAFARLTEDVIAAATEKKISFVTIE